MTMTRTATIRRAMDHFEPEADSDPQAQRRLRGYLEQIDYTAYAANLAVLAPVVGEVDAARFQRLAVAAAQARAQWAAEALAMGLVSRVLPDDDLLDACLEVAASMTRFSPYGLAMTKDVLWANLEVSSLEAAVELEDRNQLMLGFTENLPEAIRAFDAGRDPLYTDEPRRGMFPA